MLKKIFFSLILLCLVNSASIYKLEIAEGKYVNKTELTVHIDAYGSEMRFSCNKTNWSKWQSVDYSAKVKLSNIGCITKDGNKTLCIEVRDANESKIKCINFVLDRTKPEKPEIYELKYDKNSGIASIKWKSSDNIGIKGYILSIKEIVSGKDQNKYEENNYAKIALKKDERYCFAVIAIDYAGNKSEFSKEACISTATKKFEIVLKIKDLNGVERPCYRPQGIVVSVIGNRKIRTISGKITAKGKSRGIVFNCEKDICNAKLSLNKDANKATISVHACDVFELCDDKEKKIIIDKTAPQISDLNIKQLLNSLNISFEIQEKASLKIKVAGKTFSYNINSKRFSESIDISDLSDGNIKIEIVASDACGNETKIVETKRIFANVAKKMKEARQKFLDYKKMFNKNLNELLIMQKNVEKLLNDANKELAKANEYFSKADYAAMSEELIKINEIYEKLEKSIIKPRLVYKVEEAYHYRIADLKRVLKVYKIGEKTKYVSTIYLEPFSKEKFYIYDSLPFEIENCKNASFSKKTAVASFSGISKKFAFKCASKLYSEVEYFDFKKPKIFKIKKFGKSFVLFTAVFSIALYLAYRRLGR